MKKTLTALMLCLVSITMVSCVGGNNNSTSTENVNITAKQADVWQRIGSITIWDGAYTTKAHNATLFVKNVYGTNYYQIEVNGWTYGVEDNPHFLDKTYASASEQYKYMRKAGNYYLNLPGDDAATKIRQMEEKENMTKNQWRQIRTVTVYKLWSDGDIVTNTMNILQKTDDSGDLKLRSMAGHTEEEWNIEYHPHTLRQTNWPYKEMNFQYKAGPYSLNID